MNKQDKIKIGIGIVSFSTLIYLYVNEFDFIVNTMDFKNLVIYAFISGIILASFFLSKLMRGLPLFEKFMVVMASLVILAIIAPLIGSITNRLLGQRQPKIQEYELIRLEAKSEQPFGILDSAAVQTDGWRAHVRLKDKTTSFYLRKGLKFKHTQNSIFLPMKKGFWGFSYLDATQK